jgi:hypothetical protein
MKNFCSAVTCVLALSGSGYVLADYDSCMDGVEREYQLCQAKCERDVDLGNQSYNQSTWGGFNNLLQDQADTTFRQAVREGRIKESEYESYRRSQESIQRAGRITMVGRCQSACLDAKFSDAEYCD